TREAVAQRDGRPLGDGGLDRGESGGVGEAGGAFGALDLETGGGGRGAAGAGLGGRVFADGLVGEVSCPTGGADHARGGEHDDDRERPEADDVVPIPVAGLAGGADETDGRTERAPCPLARPPQVEAGDGEDEERGVAGAGDGLADGTPVAGEGEV